MQVVKIEEELSAIGENQKQLEISEEKARRREEKYQVRTRKNKLANSKDALPCGETYGLR